MTSGALLLGLTSPRLARLLLGLFGLVGPDRQCNRHDGVWVVLVDRGDDVERVDCSSVVDSESPTVDGDHFQDVEGVGEVVEEAVGEVVADEVIG